MRNVILTVILFLPSLSWAAEPHNLILFIPDGLRAIMVNQQNAPMMNSLKQNGVFFKNNHSAYPSLTMPNASVFSFAHTLGDTGIFSNSIYVTRPIQFAGDTTTPFLENDNVIDELEDQFDGHLFKFNALLDEAQSKGYNTVVVGKVGPTKLFHPGRSKEDFPILIDDLTGHNGTTLSSELTTLLTQNQLPLTPPGRGDNGQSGNANTPGTTVNNYAQQQYFINVTTQVLLPYLKNKKKPFVIIYWSRDPDGTQHNQGDSLQKVSPGINGPTSLSAIKNADDNLAQLLTSLKELQLDSTTNVVIAADHGFSTIWKESKSSFSTSQHYDDVVDHQLPPGFLAIDLSHDLGLPLYDANQPSHVLGNNEHPKFGNGLIGSDVTHPLMTIVANGGSDLIYVAKTFSKTDLNRALDILFQEDYVSGIFVNDELGHFPGTLSLSDIALTGQANTPLPAIVVNFRSSYTGCKQPIGCSVEIADTPLQQGQGMHGNFNRSDTYPFMAAQGPDFKSSFTDNAPSSNLDMGVTLRFILGLNDTVASDAAGRVLEEALLNGHTPIYSRVKRISDPYQNGLQTMINMQKIGSHYYLDSGGFAGKTLGLY